MSEFTPFPKIARLSRECVITEKIDGTNAQVYIQADVEDNRPGAVQVGNYVLWAGSRNRWLTPDSDNFGFAAWVRDNAGELVKLGAGRHFGEWWGAGIQRRYGLSEKRFSLFNVGRWADSRDPLGRGLLPDDKQDVAPACCHVVPVLYRGPFSTAAVDDAINNLARHGSHAAPGFMQPEGLIVFHTAASIMFKKTIEKDGEPKGRAA